MSEPKFRTRESRKRSTISFDKAKNRVKQSFANECDINQIMKRAQAVGMLPPNHRQKMYLDQPMPMDYAEALGLVEEAQEAFARLPASVRQECKNDPEIFLRNAQSLQWLVKQGLATQEKPEPGTPSPASPSPSAKPPGAAKGEAGPAHAGKGVAKKPKESDTSDDE